MKNTKKNGFKRNPVLALAVLGLLVGAGATGAYAVGLIPTLDQGVNGSIRAQITTSEPMLNVSGPVGLTTFSSDGKSVKFSQDLGTITAPDNATFNLTLGVHDLAGADYIVINMAGISEYVRVDMTLAGQDGMTVSGVANRVGSGQWIISTPAVDDKYDLTFDVNVDRNPYLTDQSLLNTFDMDITLANL